jgi:hypothetical protein
VLCHPLHGTEHFARVKIPTRKLRWLALEPPLHFIAVEDVVRAYVGELFPGMRRLLPPPAAGSRPARARLSAAAHGRRAPPPRRRRRTPHRLTLAVSIPESLVIAAAGP